MKNIIKYIFTVFAAAIVLAACSPQEFNNFELGEITKITEDMINFDMTPGPDEWTYNFAITGVDPVKTPYSYEIRFGDGGVAKELNGRHEFISLAGNSYKVECIISTIDGNMFIKTKQISIINDNPKAIMDDPTSLQYALTGGKANLEGKQWQLSPWSAMRDPDNRDAAWWPFTSPGETGGNSIFIMDDIFIFKPNGTFPNGSFVHDNHGDSFLHESLGNMFPDGNPAGSFVTVNYFPPTDATWKITEADGKLFLTINKGFFGYATQPDDLVEAVYEIISYTTTSVKMFLASGWDAWSYEIVAPEDPLTGAEAKTWVIDGYNEVLAEVKAGCDFSINGFMGLGPLNEYGQGWWAAGPGDKSGDNVGWTLYDWTLTFTADMKLIITTKGDGYGRKAFDGKGFNSTKIDGDDMTFPYDGGEYTFTLDKTATPVPKLTLSGNAFTGYYCGSQEYEVLYLSATAMALLVHNTTEGQDWIFVYKPAD